MIPKRKLFGLVLFALPFISSAQENSPYSRYGVGNIVPAGNIFNRGMGGISAGTLTTSINFLNPATYSNFSSTTLDIGSEVTSRTIKSLNPVDKFTANNAIISYIQIGVPLLAGNKKALKKNISWGLDFGLRPVTRINYKIAKFSRNSIDSIATLYEGDGGVNEAFVGTGIRVKDFSIGVNAGYLFGNKNYSTRLSFLNDTVAYNSSNSSTQTSFGGAFINGGMQYVTQISKLSVLRLGAYGRLQQKYAATQDIVRETFVYNVISGSPERIDSVSEIINQKGTVQLPSSYAIGFSVENQHLLFGLDYESTNWNSYRFYGQKDLVKNNWMVKGGVQFLPAGQTSKKYFNFVKYRAGFYFGPDYISADKNLPQYGITLGGGFPLKLRHAYYDYQYSVMNLAIDYGSRGNKNNNIRENTFRVSVGFTLSDAAWFRRAKYD
jgi:hypothetical protein